jgi:phenylacetate-CoA ligase
MNTGLVALYNHLPSFLRSFASTWHGQQLKRLRYGPATDQMVEEALSRETWTADQWREWQNGALRKVLNRAANRVPFYRDLWARRRRLHDDSSWEMLENWPILDKETLRSDPRAFLADDRVASKMLHVYTSGTTGKPLEMWQGRDTVRSWYALFEARWRRWYGVTRHSRYGMLGGQLVTPVEQRKPPFWVWNSSLNQLYFSSYHLAPDLIGYYLDAIVRYRIEYLWGYASSLCLLAETALRQNRTDLKMKVVVLNAEPVYDYQRQTIEAAFQCPARETYGMTEKLAAASECEFGNLHLWPEAGIIEVLENDRPVSPGESGELVITGLLQRDMPLIRYRIGDRGSLRPPNQTCNCGRTLPMIAAVDGRSDDILYTSDGRGIGRLDPVFKVGLPVKEIQIIQEAIDRLRVRLVPTARFSQADADLIRNRLYQRMGKLEILFETVDVIPRGPNGKFRAVICQLPSRQRSALAAASGQHRQ